MKRSQSLTVQLAPRVTVKSNNMKNEKLQEVLKTYTKKSNKDLAQTLVILEKDFNSIKNLLLDLTETLNEIETTYDAVYGELEKRIKK